MYWNLYFTIKNRCINWWFRNRFTYFNIFHYHVYVIIHSRHYLQNWTILRLKKMLFGWLLLDHWTFTSSWWNSRLYKKVFCWRTFWIIQNLRNDLDSLTLGIVRSSTWKKSSHQIVAKIIQEWKIRKCTSNWRDLKVNWITWIEVRTFCRKIPQIITARQTSFRKCDYRP